MSAEANEEKSGGHGDHWGCFTGGVSQFIGQYLPVTISQGTLATVQTKHEKVMTSAQKGSQQYPAGFSWPEGDLRFLTLIMIDNEIKKNEVWSAYPWAVCGMPHALAVEEIIPWKNGIEGQIKILFAETVPLTFFDTLYYINHRQYVVGESYQFSLAGFAYQFSVIDPEPIRIENPEAIQRLRSAGFGKAKDDGGDQLEPIIIETKGMAAFLQLEGWDDDDYSFRAPVVEVEELEFLDEPLWRIRATVLRVEDHEFDLNIYVTGKVMGDGRMPQIGDDIQGAMWLQGHLLHNE